MTPRRSIPFALALAALGCEVETPPAPASIDGAENITFRCVARTEAELEDIRARLPVDRRAEFVAVGAPGAPLDGCGCTTIGDDGAITFLPRDLCAAGNAEIRAYVGSNDRGELAVLRVTRDATFADRRILDVDNTIPGVTGIFVDDIVTAIETDPDGRFVLSINSSSGTFSIAQDDRAVLPTLTVDPGVGPLLAATVWPAPERGIDRATLSTRSAPRRAWITAPQSQRILEVDLDDLAALVRAEEPDGDVVTRVLDLPDGVPGNLAVHPLGHMLYVGHALAPRISVFDLTTGERTADIDLSRRPVCGDGYLVDLIAASSDRSCDDGLDNDGDGAIDAADDDCAGPHGIESPDPACPQRFECDDRVDNDGDGLIDADDEDCDAVGRWEGAPPECANGEDDDGDGLIDRADPGCDDEGDDSEADGDTFEGPGPGGRCYAAVGAGETDPDGDGLTFIGGAGCETCDDGVDNDADGLVDAEDPGCTDPDFAPERYTEERISRCADGIDQDRDGLVDFAGGDPDCSSASDDSEGGSTLEIGPTGMLTAEVPLGDALLYYLYAIEPGGYLVAIDLDDPTLRVRYTGLRGAVQAMTLRAFGLARSLLTVLSDTSLRSVEITEPIVMRTRDGHDIHARLPEAWGNASARIVASTGTLVNDFYVVHQGVARRVDALSGLCAPERPVDGACADPDHVVVTDVCLPSACESDSDCVVGACLGGYCLPPCETDADCGRGRQCSDNVCRTACTFTDPSLLFVEPRVGCDHDLCGVECETSADCAPAGLACIDSACAPGCADGACTPDIDLDTALPIVPRARGAGDVVARLTHRRVVHDEVNALQTVARRTNRVPEVPRLLIRGTPVGADAARFPVFCQLPQPYLEADAGPIDADEPCVPESGTEATRSGPPELIGQSCTVDLDCVDARLRCDDGECTPCADAGCRLRYRTDLYGGIQIVTDDPDEILDQEFLIGYEADLPGSESFTGRFAGTTTVTVDDPADPSRAEVPAWVLVDYESDFCRTGVEVGDVLVIDRMAPLSSAAEDPACDPFIDTNTNLAPDQRREPIRYRIAEVGPFRLVLRRDGASLADRIDYGDMLTRDDRVPQPAFAPSLPPPPAQCAAQLTAYRIRASDQWLLIGARNGYRHPWMRAGGECVVDPDRADRHSRVDFGQPFDNEWFRFRLGDARGEDGALPYMVDAEYRFRVVNGYEESVLEAAARVPQGMRWLPNNDHVYIVDGGRRSVMEIGGLDVYRDVMGIIIQTSPYD